MCCLDAAHGHIDIPQSVGLSGIVKKGVDDRDVRIIYQIRSGKQQVDQTRLNGRNSQFVELPLPSDVYPVVNGERKQLPQKNHQGRVPPPVFDKQRNWDIQITLELRALQMKRTGSLFDV